jgi:class 3 adenylate cyclase
MLWPVSEVDDPGLRRVLQRLTELGATEEELEEALRTGQISDLALDVAIRPPGETMTLDQFAEASGLDEQRVRDTWSALGLPATGPVRVTPDAAAALRFLAAAGDLFQLESAQALARVMGSTSSRLAEALVAAFRVDIELPGIDSGADRWKQIDETITAGQQLLPLFIEAVNAVFRRHMVLVSYQLWHPDEQRATVTHERTVGFADLVSSTASVRSATPADLAVMVREFEARVWELVTDAGGRVVKLIGDEAMFVIEDPVRACAAALDLVDSSPQPVRVGLAHGLVVSLYGDYYGETVNLAARLVTAADTSTVVVSDSVRTGAGDAFGFDALPERELKGFDEPVRFYRASRH